MTMERAYALLEIKAVDDEKREITGIATTPATDRMGDIVEPKGAEFKLPIPFLWQHNVREPVGFVTRAKVAKEGIEIVASIPKILEEGDLQKFIDKCWQQMKYKLVRGLSIGFQSVESTRIDETFSRRFIKWLWLELSAVTIAANEEAEILTVKSIIEADRAASGLIVRSPVRLITKSQPGVTGHPATEHIGAVKLIPRKRT